MKKRYLRVTLLAANLCVFALFFASCSTLPDNKNQNIKPSDVVEKLSVPRIVSFGDYLSWEEVKGATEYEIYQNGTVVSITSKYRYDFGALDADTEYFIKAKNETNTSASSNIVTASKNHEFNPSEILDLSNSSTYRNDINAQIRKVIISNGRGEMRFLCNLKERTNDIVFELTNVAIRGCITTADGSYSRKTHDYNVILNVSGNCSILGENGLSPSIQFEPDTESDGIEGAGGGSAIVAPTTIVKGNGQLTLKGGNGGNGGNGAATTTFSNKTVGKGSNGGAGGAGILCQYLLINMDKPECSVHISGGLGGNKGSPGSNNSIITGPLVSAMWNDIYDIGKDGNNGVRFKGLLTVTNGNLI